MDHTLSSLLLDLSALSDAEAEEVTYQEYIHLYTDRDVKVGRVGVRATHDGEEVVFFADRFEHGFFTSDQRTSRPYNKRAFDRDRAIRVRWIGPVVSGNIENTECREIPEPSRRYASGRIMTKRLYLLREENYLIWLEPLRGGRWKFSSAYVASKQYIRQVTSKGCCIWHKKTSRD